MARRDYFDPVYRARVMAGWARKREAQREHEGPAVHGQDLSAERRLVVDEVLDEVLDEIQAKRRNLGGG